MTAHDPTVAVLRAAAGYVHEFGMNREPHWEDSPSLGKIICTAHTLAGVDHTTEDCRRLQIDVANYGDAATLAELVARTNTRAIVELLRRLAAIREAAGLAVAQ